MSKMITFDDVPAEVWEVWAIRTVGQPIGMDTWNRCNETIKKYPEYFEWEHKYDKIPKGVHDAYDREANPVRYEPLKLESREGYVGLIPYLMSPPEIVDISNEKTYTIAEILSNLFNAEREKEKLKRDAKAARKKMWDKHYSKYGLEYRE